MIRTIFFDIDGTLVDYPGAERAAARLFYRQHRQALAQSEATFLLRWQGLTEKYFQLYLDGELTREQQRRARLREVLPDWAEATDEALDRLFAVYLRDFENSWRLYPDVAACLARLDGYVLGIVSNGHGAQQRQKLAVLNIAAQFRHVAISGDIGLAKPAAGIFHAACAMAGRAPAECLYVGDKLEVDAGGAARAGMASLWLNRDDASHAAGQATIHSLAGLHAHL